MKNEIHSPVISFLNDDVLYIEIVLLWILVNWFFYVTNDWIQFNSINHSSWVDLPTTPWQRVILVFTFISFSDWMWDSTRSQVEQYISPFCWDSFVFVCMFLFLPWNNTKHSGYEMSCYLARCNRHYNRIRRKTRQNDTVAFFAFRFVLFTFFCVRFFSSFWSNSKGEFHTQKPLYIYVIRTRTYMFRGSNGVLITQF